MFQNVVLLNTYVNESAVYLKYYLNIDYIDNILEFLEMIFINFKLLLVEKADC